jgi:hypothetical protein
MSFWREAGVGARATGIKAVDFRQGTREDGNSHGTQQEVPGGFEAWRKRFRTRLRDINF